MSMLIAELLELARLDRTSSLDLTETDLAALARDAVADARAVEPDRPVTAEVPSSLVVIADESGSARCWPTSSATSGRTPAGRRPQSCGCMSTVAVRCWK